VKLSNSWQNTSNRGWKGVSFQIRKRRRIKTKSNSYYLLRWHTSLLVTQLLMTDFYVSRIAKCPPRFSTVKIQISNCHLNCRKFGLFSINTFILRVDILLLQTQFWKPTRMNLVLEYYWHETAVFAKHKLVICAP
jgi:hypothetical protein